MNSRQFNLVFMNRLDTIRKNKHWSIPVICEMFDDVITEKEYRWYQKGIQTPSPALVLKAVDVFGRDAFGEVN